MRGLRRIPILRTFGAGGKPWARSDKIAAGVGVCSVALAAATIVQTQVNSAHEPDLRVVAVSAKLSEEIDATEEYSTGIVVGSNTVFTPKVDITVRNAGEAEALITRADLTFRRATRLARCVEVGGEMAIAADYHVKVPAPWGDPFKLYSLAAPFTLHREMRFQVEALSHDRFTLTVGPKRIHEMAMPWIYEIEVSLVHDGTDVLPVGPVVLLSAAGQNGIDYGEENEEGDGPDSPSDEELRCQRANLAFVDKEVRRPGEKSAGLLSYQEDLRTYLEDLGG
ncbi:hypothetical protein ACPCHT_02980 [Nucisporomicrobium flavum]|uniref:hypothetical protein n=1 Tax=Nucisporomicrobium flavum TaxID=2785915 RepID=UPI003C2DB636